MSRYRKHFDLLADAWPTRSSFVMWSVSLLVLVVLMPVYGLLEQPLSVLLRIYGFGDIGRTLCVGLMVSYLPIFIAKRAHLKRIAPFTAKTKEAEIYVGPMRFTLPDLCTSTLVTGSPGTGKTAGVVLPMIAALAATFKEENAPVTSDFQKFGALILEVKGDLTEACVYLMHKAGRCVSRDLLIVSPVSRVPIVRFADEKGRFWHLCGRGGTDGNDAGAILPALLHPKTGYAMPSDAFDRGSAYLEEVDGVLKSCTIPVGDLRLRYMGWRWDGNDLVRVLQTTGFEQVERLLVNGKEVRVTPPKTLTYVEVINVSNGIHYNFIDGDVSATEAASRLAKVIQMAQGEEGGGGKDPYWQNQMRKLIASCIMLHKEVEPEECTARDIIRMVTQETILDNRMDKLSKRIQVLQKKAENYSTRDAREDYVLKNVNPLEDLAAYFQEEWKKMVADGKTANIIKSFVSGAFDSFLTDPNLGETFCNPSTFRFEDCVQTGKIIAVVPGRNYQKTATIFGTAIKEGFQGVLLSRNQRSDLNPKRVVVQLIDEAQRHIVAAGTEAGDHYFMAQCRSNRVICIYATQSYAWITKAIGKDASNVFLTCVGNQFWLQQTDPETTKRASEICGSSYEEKRSAETNLNLFEVAGGKGGSVKQKISMEEKARYKPEDFTLLSTSDVIIFNKGEEGRRDKVKKGKLEFGYVTSSAGRVEAGALFREYYREYMENQMFTANQTHYMDCDPAVANGDAPARQSAHGATPEGEVPTVPVGPDDTTADPAGQPSGTTAPDAPKVFRNDSPQSVIPEVPYQSVMPLVDDQDAEYALQHENPIRIEELLRGELGGGETAPLYSEDDRDSGDTEGVEYNSPEGQEAGDDGDDADMPLPESPRGLQSIPRHNSEQAPSAPTKNPPVFVPGAEGSSTDFRKREFPDELPTGSLTQAELARHRLAHDRLDDFPGILRAHVEDAALANRLVQEMMEMAHSATPEQIPDRAVSGPGGQLLGDTTKAAPVVPVPETVEGDLLGLLERAQSEERARVEVDDHARRIGVPEGPGLNLADDTTIRKLYEEQKISHRRAM